MSDTRPSFQIYLPNISLHLHMSFALCELCIFCLSQDFLEVVCFFNKTFFPPQISFFHDGSQTFN
jgi:hypothetical protein